MILNSQPLSEFASIRVNWWSVSSQCPATPSLPILPILPQIHGALMQNKANYQKVKTAVTSCAERTYPECPAPPRPKKQSQSNPIPQRNTPPRPLAGRYATRNTKNKSNQTQFPARSAVERPSRKIHTPFTLLPQDDMNRDCFAERGLEQANAANREEVPPLNVRCN
jgi:hypothetical protein